MFHPVCSCTPGSRRVWSTVKSCFSPVALVSTSVPTIVFIPELPVVFFHLLIPEIAGSNFGSVVLSQIPDVFLGDAKRFRDLLVRKDSLSGPVGVETRVMTARLVVS